MLIMKTRFHTNLLGLDVIHCCKSSESRTTYPVILRGAFLTRRQVLLHLNETIQLQLLPLKKPVNMRL